ncbi:DNA recombination protein RmuC [Sphingomonas solaris]|uniref:DNA recombination protein RmuC homolog n=1 Tax=Alterirhizorhabdus solaris TaxID=2529389 RepID=A0A558QUS0_9SPHN|nr:DNA recombination protein RmuC [Sphingomonas solaris]TVV70901.1 DNA recombination protein RmuC [Sphingomonas solaris]
MSALSLIAVLVALAIGLGCGWLVWGRAGAALAAERNDLREKFGRAIADLNLALGESRQLGPLREDLATARREQEALRTDTALARREAADAAAEARGLAADRAARIEATDAQAVRLADVQAAGAALRIDLDAARRETFAAREELRGLRADREARDEAAEAQLRQLIEAKEALSAQFGEVGARLLDAAQRQFLERADQRFNQAGNASEEKIKAALAPVEATLKRYEEGVARVEEARRSEQNQLTGLIDAMRTGQEAVRGEAARLVNALRAAPKARGRWGEQQLRNVLETCGLSEHADFQTEVSVSGEEGRIRPDVIVRVPGGRALVIDAKVSLNAYQDAYETVDDAERHRHLAAHAAAMKAHVNGLGGKAYWAEFEEAPDYVIMFVPGEHFLSAALEHDPTLWDFAFGKRVLLATPTNLIAIARTVAAVWRQEKVAKEAKAIAGLGKEMYDRLATAAGHLKKVGGGLTTAVNNYNSFVGSFERNVLSTGRKFRDMNIETGAKELEEVPPVEALARYGDEPLLPAPVEREAAE